MPLGEESHAILFMLIAMEVLIKYLQAHLSQVRCRYRPGGYFWNFWVGMIVSLRLWTPQPVLDLVQMNFVTIFESFYPKYQGFQLFLFDFSLQFPFVSYDVSQFFCDCIRPVMDKGSKNLIPICIASVISCPCFFSLCWKNTSDIRTNSL